MVVLSLPRPLSVVTSGIYQRYYMYQGRRYHHLLDPQTGDPVENDLSGVTVLAESSLEADGLSTVLFLWGRERGLEYVNQTDGIEAVFITKTKEIYHSDGIQWLEREGSKEGKGDPEGIWAFPSRNSGR